jgi:hypothetical protein
VYFNAIYAIQMRKAVLSFLLSENIIKFFKRKKGRFENRPPGYSLFQTATAFYQISPDGRKVFPCERGRQAQADPALCGDRPGNLACR